MASESSFDIVSKVDKQEVERAVHGFADAVEAGTAFSSKRAKSVHDAGADDTDHPHESLGQPQSGVCQPFFHPAILS